MNEYRRYPSEIGCFGVLLICFFVWVLIFMVSWWVVSAVS